MDCPTKRLTPVVILVESLPAGVSLGASVESINELVCSGLLESSCDRFPLYMFPDLTLCVFAEVDICYHFFMKDQLVIFVFNVTMVLTMFDFWVCGYLYAGVWSICFYI